MTIEDIMENAVNAKKDELSVLREKAEIKRKLDYDACIAFLNEIAVLAKYGICYELYQRQYNVHSADEEYFLPRFGWRVELRFVGAPFYELYCKKIDGVVKAKWRSSILWHGPKIDGEDKDGYFTAEQFASYWAKEVSMRM